MQQKEILRVRLRFFALQETLHWFMDHDKGGEAYEGGNMLSLSGRQ